MLIRSPILAVLLLVAAALVARAQELVVTAESPGFVLDTRLATGSGSSPLVVMAESSAFALDTRLAPSPGPTALVVTATSPAFTLDTRLSNGSGTATLVVTASSGAFVLDTRLVDRTPLLAGLVVTAESGLFRLDARLATRREDLIVEALSPLFEVNTMWLRLRRLARAFGSPLELYWTTNAPGFHPQVTDPPLSPASIWRDLTDPVTEHDGLNHVPVAPSGTNRYFRLKL